MTLNAHTGLPDEAPLFTDETPTNELVQLWRRHKSLAHYALLNLTVARAMNEKMSDYSFFDRPDGGAMTHHMQVLHSKLRSNAKELFECAVRERDRLALQERALAQAVILRYAPHASTTGLGPAYLASLRAGFQVGSTSPILIKDLLDLHCDLKGQTISMYAQVEGKEFNLDDKLDLVMHEDWLELVEYD